MTQVNAYLNFNGQCREAMTFYKHCFGGDLIMQKISESPMAAQMPSELGGHILHSSLNKNGILLMASDMMGQKVVKGNTVTLCFNCNDEEEASVCFDKLSDGGTVKTPLHQSFWGGTYGELTDKYGMFWMFNCSKN